MISGKKRYKFNTETLSFVEVKRSTGKKFLKGFASFIIVNIAAILILIALYSFIDSPEARLQKVRIDRYNVRYELLSLRVDSLASTLKSENRANDQIYRYILELDSISENIRSAGTGGHDPYAGPMNMYANKVFSGLMTQIENLKLQIGIQEESYEEIMNTALDRNKKLQHFPGIPPINLTDRIWISSYFGSRDDPFTSHQRWHKGVDFVGPRNTEIYATANGIVTLAKQSRKGYGNEIVIDHLFGHCTRYAHLSKILVTEGQKIQRGQLIGYMGNTGRSTGVHLHYEVQYLGRPLNPIFFFADDLSPAEFEQLAKKTD